MQKEKMARDSKKIQLAVPLAFYVIGNFVRISYYIKSSARMRTRAKKEMCRKRLRSARAFRERNAFWGQEILLVGEEEE